MLNLDRRAVAATGIALLALAAAPASAQGLRDITFVQPSPSAINSFPIYVAIGEGYFADEGLNVNVESVNGSSAVLQALTADQAKFGRPGPGPVLDARARGVDVVFIYNQMPKSSFGIVVKEESSYQTPEDLKGQVIGVGTADGAEVSFARGVLSALGMTENAGLRVPDGRRWRARHRRLHPRRHRGLCGIDRRRGDPQPARPRRPRHHAGGVHSPSSATATSRCARPSTRTRSWSKASAARSCAAQMFAMDDANRETVLAHLKAGMPQESEDPDVRLGAVRGGPRQDDPAGCVEGLGLPGPRRTGSAGTTAWSRPARSSSRCPISRPPTPTTSCRPGTKAARSDLGRSRASPDRPGRPARRSTSSGASARPSCGATSTRWTTIDLQLAKGASRR